MLRIVLACVLLAGSLSPAAEQTGGLNQAQQRGLERLLDNVEGFTNRNALDALLAEMDLQSPKTTLPEEFERLLGILSVVERKIDFDFDLANPKSLPEVNIAPPSDKYFSGVDPSAIKEPEIRKQYEQALAENQAKAKKWRLQQQLRQIREQIFLRMRISHRSYLKDAKSFPQITNNLERYHLTQEARARILELTKSPPP